MVGKNNCFNSIAKFSFLPWFEMAGEIWKVGRKVMRGLSSEGLYEVIDYESTLELHDRQGEKATFSKRQKVRYLQNHTIAFEDQAWGDGKILIDYNCSPGTPVDQYRIDYKTLILISLREVKNRGDSDTFNIRWGIRNGFSKNTELWATEVRRRIRNLKVSLIFPEDRPPQRWVLIEKNRQRTLSLGKESRQKLPDGRWKIRWEKHKPKLFETYILKWEW